MSIIESVSRKEATRYLGPQTPNIAGFESFPFEDWVAGVIFHWYSFVREDA